MKQHKHISIWSGSPLRNEAGLSDELFSHRYVKAIENGGALWSDQQDSAEVKLAHWADICESNKEVKK